MPHQRGMVFHRLHHVHGNHAAPFGFGFGRLNFTVQGNVVEFAVFFFGRVDFGFGQQIFVQMAQIHAGNSAQAVFARHRAGQSRCGNTDTHAALHDWN